MKTKRTMNANVPNETRKAVYARDGYRCALCDDVRGLQLHHIIKRSCGGNDTPHNLITLCWRCHAEAHGTAIPERHTYQRTSWEDRQSLAEEYEQACTEYICDYYADMGIIADPVNGGGL